MKYLLFIVLLPLISYSQEVEKSEDAPKVKKWEAVLSVGASFSSKTEAELKFLGSSIASGSEKGNTAPALGIEVNYVANDFFKIAGGTTYTQFKYKGSSIPDEEISFMITPKFYHKFGAFQVWAGPSVGLLDFDIGEPKATYSDGSSLRADDERPTIFTYGARLGLNFDINEKFFAGFELYYQSMSSSLDVTYTDTSGAKYGMAYNINRSWMGSLACFGFKF